MRTLPLLIVLLLTVSVSSAITTQAICTAGTDTISNPTICSIQSGIAYGVEAEVISTTVSGGFQAGVGTALYTEADILTTGPSLLAAAYSNVSSEFDSAGPLRQGLIDFSATELPGSGASPIQLSVSDGVHYYVFSCNTIGVGCNDNETLPFDLGTEFLVTDIVSASSGIISAEGDGVDRPAAYLNFSLEESNGTPVESVLDLTIAPEPSALALVGVTALLAYGWWSYRKA